MTGTAREVASELWSVYRLNVVTIPTNRPTRRTAIQDNLYLSAERKWQAVVQCVRDLHEQGRPVLIGMRSVVASETLSRELGKAGLIHRVLNARQDQQEAEEQECWEQHHAYFDSGGRYDHRSCTRWNGNRNLWAGGNLLSAVVNRRADRHDGSFPLVAYTCSR